MRLGAGRVAGERKGAMNLQQMLIVYDFWGRWLAWWLGSGGRGFNLQGNGQVRCLVLPGEAAGFTRGCLRLGKIVLDLLM